VKKLPMILAVLWRPMVIIAFPGRSGYSHDALPAKGQTAVFSGNRKAGDLIW